MGPYYYRWLVCGLMLLPAFYLQAQIVPNGTFNGPAGTTNTPDGWFNCDPESSVEVQPGRWNVRLPAYDGRTYLGMACRGPNEFVPNSCEEILRDLSEPLEIGTCYELEVYLANDPGFEVPRFRTPIYLDIYLATDLCTEEFQVARFGPVDHAEWQAYTATFTADAPYFVIWLQASTGDADAYSGHILADALSIREGTNAALELGPDLELCSGDLVTLEVADVVGELEWQDGSTEVRYTVRESGTYYVTSTSDCGIQTDTIVVNYEDLPIAPYLGNDTTLCAGETLMLLVDDEQYDEVLWQDSIRAATFTVNDAGTYSLTVTNACGEANESINVNYLQAPVIQLGADTTICEGKSIILSVPPETDNFSWDDGVLDLERSVATAGVYVLSASNACGSSVGILTLTIDPCNCFIYFPNAFSPNLDGINDHFGPGFDCNMESYRMNIFDRWGNQVFTSEETSVRWDGTFRNKLLPSGTYVYMASYQFIDKPLVQQQGTIALIR